MPNFHACAKLGAISLSRFMGLKHPFSVLLLLIGTLLMACVPLEGFIPENMDVVVYNLKSSAVSLEYKGTQLNIKPRDVAQIVNVRSARRNVNLLLDGLPVSVSGNRFYQFSRIDNNGKPKGAIFIIIADCHVFHVVHIHQPHAASLSDIDYVIDVINGVKASPQEQILNVLNRSGVDTVTCTPRAGP